MAPYAAVNSSQSRLPASATRRPRRPAGLSRGSGLTYGQDGLWAMARSRHQRACFAGQPVGGVELDDQDAGGGFLRHLGPCGRAVCLLQNCAANTCSRKLSRSGMSLSWPSSSRGSRGKRLAEAAPLEVAAASARPPGEHARAIALRHAMLVAHFHPEQARRVRVL